MEFDSFDGTDGDKHKCFGWVEISKSAVQYAFSMKYEYTSPGISKIGLFCACYLLFHWPATSRYNGAKEIQIGSFDGREYG